MEAMMPYLAGTWGNPSATHSFGREARRAVEEARAKIARVIGAHPDEVCFTSGGSESDSWALLEGARARENRMHVITSAIEHKAVLNSCHALEKQGFRVSRIQPEADGVVSAERVRDAMGENTGLVSVMMANNEIGTLQPVAEIAGFCAEKGVLMHTDAVQTAGVLPICVGDLGVHFLSASAHKFHGPKGVGFLYIRRGIRMENRVYGGAQERGKRGGTENVAGIVGMAAALQDAEENRASRAAQVQKMRDAMQCAVLKEIPGVFVNGSAEKRLPGNLNLRFEGIDGQALLMRLDMAGIAASAGSACTAGSVEVSHVLQAMGLTREEAVSSLRFSLSHETTHDEVVETVRVLKESVAAMRSLGK